MNNRDLYLRPYSLDDDGVELFKSLDINIEVVTTFNSRQVTALMTDEQYDIISLNHVPLDSSFMSHYRTYGWLRSPEYQDRTIIDEYSVALIISEYYMSEPESVAPFFDHIVEHYIPRVVKYDSEWLINPKDIDILRGVDKSTMYILSIMHTIKHSPTHLAEVLLKNIIGCSEYNLWRNIVYFFPLLREHGLVGCLENINFNYLVTHRESHCIELLDNIPECFISSIQARIIIEHIVKKSLYYMDNSKARALLRIIEKYNISCKSVVGILVHTDFMVGAEYVKNQENKNEIMLELASFDSVKAIKIARELKMKKESIQTLFKDYSKDVNRILSFYK